MASRSKPKLSTGDLVTLLGYTNSLSIMWSHLNMTEDSELIVTMGNLTGSILTITNVYDTEYFIWYRTDCGDLAGIHEDDLELMFSI